MATIPETGGQPTHTSGNTDIAGIAAQCGFKVTRAISDLDSIAEDKSALLNGDGPVMVVAKVALKTYGTIVEPTDPDSDTILPLAFEWPQPAETALDRQKIQR